MKKYCKSIEQVPTNKEILKLTQKEHLVLEFSTSEKKTIPSSEIISALKKKLPENYSIFNSGIRNDTFTITIKPVIARQTIEENYPFIKKALLDYIAISKALLTALQANKNLDDNWILIEEHGEHNYYQNTETGQTLETCAYPITNFKSIDPYFFGLFINTATNYTELKKIIKDDYHDTCRVLDFIGDNENLKKQIETYMK